jgi:hypothetical protein
MTTIMASLWKSHLIYMKLKFILCLQSSKVLVSVLPHDLLILTIWDVLLKQTHQGKIRSTTVKWCEFKILMGLVPTIIIIMLKKRYQRSYFYNMNLYFQVNRERVGSFSDLTHFLVRKYCFWVFLTSCTNYTMYMCPSQQNKPRST